MKRAAFLSLILITAFGQSQVDPGLMSGMKWRLIGPFRGGRSLAVTGSVQHPKTFFMGATGGGIWKSTDSGQEWVNVSDGFLGTASIGALATAPSNADILYAGTGEGDIRGDISHGDGVYRSTDDGKTWTKAGLSECQTISRIVVHPNNPDVAYAAALGHAYVKRDLNNGKVVADPNRGIYKTVDGGKTWKQVLFRSPVAGGIDVDLDPSNPEIVYAALWEAWRTPYSLNSGGPGSGMFKSTDGGATWTELTHNKGLPTGTIGKIGMSVSPVNPKRVWAIVEALDGGIFRSDDAGATWTKVNENRNWRQRAWYYTHIYADPKDVDTFYVLNVGAGKSTDGGKSFTPINPPHGDNHDLWLAPDDPKRFIEANDGGASVSLDGGQSWSDQDMPTGQFYHVSTDNNFPYRILGAQQDSSTVRIFSRTESGGIRSTDWTSTAGGESGYVVAKPNDPDIVYGGNYSAVLERRNHRTGKSRDMNPWPDNPMGHGAIDSDERFQWTFPIVFSPHSPNVMYTCSQHVFKSNNGGETWKAISPDLTRNDPRTLQSSGGPITKDNTSVEYYGTVFTFAESPVTPGVLWAGTDDGRVHVSRDAGASWQEVTPKDMPKWALCSMIEASAFDDKTAYLAVDNHENDDYTPYVYITHDSGKSWRKMVTGIAGNTFMRVVREDPKQEGLLVGGTESGVVISFDDGETWQSFNLNLPLTPVHDLVFKDDDIVLATHGRGFWVMDSASSLHHLAATKPNAFRLYPVNPAYRVTWGGFGGFGRRGGGPTGPSAANPPSGILVDFYLPAAGTAKVELVDAQDKVAFSSEVSGVKGFNRATALPSYPGFRTFPGMILWSGGSGPIAGPPGTYTVRVTVGGVTQTATAVLKGDPRNEASDADLRAQYEMAIKVRDRVSDANDGVVRIRAFKSKLAEVSKDSKPAAAMIEKLSAIEEELYQVKNQSGQDPLNYPIKLNNRMAALLDVVLTGEGRPTDQCYVVFAKLDALLKVQLDALDKVVADDLPKVNADLKKHGKKEIENVKARGEEATGGRRGRGGEEEEEREGGG